MFGEAAPVPASPSVPSPPPQPAPEVEAPPEPVPVPAGSTASAPPADLVPPDLDEPPAPEPPEQEALEPEAPAAGEPAVPTTVPADTPAQEMVTIRALGDIPPFVGPDMQTYLLREGDFAMVPPAIATLLERRGKAEVMQAA